MSSCTQAGGGSRGVERPTDFKTACAAWIHAGGARRTGYSYPVTTATMEGRAEISGIDLVVIDADTRLRAFKDGLRHAEMYSHLAPGRGRL